MAASRQRGGPAELAGGAEEMEKDLLLGGALQEPALCSRLSRAAMTPELEEPLHAARMIKDPQRLGLHRDPVIDWGIKP